MAEYMDNTEKTKHGKTPFSEMFVGKAQKPKKADYYDYSLLAVIILLTCFGLVMLYSTSAYMAELDYGDDMFYFKKQALISAASIVLAVVISRIDYHILRNFTTLAYVGSLVLMALVKTPLGVTSHGARRWLGIGETFSFQPAEIAKIALILFFAQMIVTMGKSKETPGAFFTMLGLGAIQAGGALVFTDNLSTAIILMGITIGMIYISNPNKRLFWSFMLVCAVLGTIVVLYLMNTLESSDNFRIQRVLVWLHPEDYASGDGYQTLQALYAIGSGGFFGRGLGNSIQKLGSVPEAQNDFIFSIICEELGMIGGIIVLLFFGYLLYRLFFIAQNAPDMYGSLIVSGIFIHLSLQVILNISVVLNLMPNTGVTLPFISYGGTSILFLMAEIGIALSVSRKIRFQTVLEDLL